MSSTTPHNTVASTTPAADQPAADRAYQHVKSGLLSGTYPDGHLFSEGEIATSLNMSRTPVREAFLRLQTEGFLRLYPKRGALVVPVTPAEATSLIETRLALEHFALDKLALEGPDAMREIGQELATHPACDADDLTDAQLHEADRDFHARLVRSSGNPVVTDLYNGLRDRQMRLTATARTHNRRGHITRQHAEVAEAIRTGDAHTAKHRLREHLVDTVRALGITPTSFLEP